MKRLCFSEKDNLHDMYNGFVVTDTIRNNKVYGGTTLKFGITLNNKDYIVKFPKDDRISSIFSEFVASTFITQLGFNAHEVYLGVYKGINNVSPVVILRDFTDAIFSLKSFDAINQSSEDTDIYGHKSYTYNDIIYILEKNTKMLKSSKSPYCLRFWITFILDAILANRDRHGGNWGYLTDGLIYKEAPIYDNGSSLFPELEKTINQYFIDKVKFLELRADYFPASIIKHYESGIPKRMNYFEALNFLLVDDYFIAALSDFNSVIDLTKIIDAVNVTIRTAKDAGIPENYLEFYKAIIIARYLRMINRYDVTVACNEALCLVGV